MSSENTCETFLISYFDPEMSSPTCTDIGPAGFYIGLRCSVTWLTCTAVISRQVGADRISTAYSWAETFIDVWGRESYCEWRCSHAVFLVFNVSEPAFSFEICSNGQILKNADLCLCLSAHTSTDTEGVGSVAWLTCTAVSSRQVGADRVWATNIWDGTFIEIWGRESYYLSGLSNPKNILLA